MRAAMLKRKRKVLNFQQKVEILQRLKEGTNGKTLANEYGIGTSTISDLRRNADDILQYVSNLNCQISVKKTRKTAQNVELDSKVYLWYREQVENEVEPSDTMVCAKALEISQELPNSLNFKASMGWLRHFKERHGIRERKEALPPSPQKLLRNYVKRGGYLLQNVYIVDECSLHWQRLPNSLNPSLARVILCTSVEGSHKLPLHIIGEETSEEALTFPLFQSWFEEVFAKEVINRQKHTGSVGKIMLILNQAPWHLPREELLKNYEEITLYYIPNDETIQWSLTESFRVIFKTRLLEYFLKEKSLPETTFLMRDIWSLLLKPEISHAWNKLLLDSEPKVEPDLGRIVSLCQEIPELASLSHEAIDLWVKEVEDGTGRDDQQFECKQEEIFFQEAPCSHSAAYQSLQTVINWYSQQDELNRDYLAILTEVQNLAAGKMSDDVKQEDDYFENAV